MNTKQNMNELMSKVYFVRLNKPEEIIHKLIKTSNKQVKNAALKIIDSLNSNEKEAERLKCNNVLNQICPPKEWEEDGKLYRQTLSNQPAVLGEVKALAESLKMYLEQFEVKEVGICPIRREIYLQCFNEIIRQETLNCTERGHLLIQIRDEMKMTVEAYQELNESVIGSWIRKILLGEQKKSNLKKRMVLLKSENEKLEAELAKINAKTKEIEYEMIEIQDREENVHSKELDNLKKANQLLKARIVSIIMPTKRI